ncbi:hypothetical protein ACLB1G_07440 [Oxalobacteraceae bacterium A2-2]
MIRSIFSLTLLASTQVSADEVLFSGHVLSSTVIPIGAPGCPSLNSNTPTGNGGATITISNDCGCMTTRLKVDEVLAGTMNEAEFTLSQRVGEWCRLDLAAATGPVLMQTGSGQPSWSGTRKKPDGLYFQTRRFQSLAGILASSLKADGEGMASLDELKQRLRQQRGGN